MDSKSTWINLLVAIAFFVGIFGVLTIDDRTQFVELILLYALSFGAYLYLISKSTLSFRNFLLIGISAHLFAVFILPSLSIDYFRFLWDGELFWKGINPFNFRPTELIQQSSINHSAYLNELYVGFGEMSQQNYTVYPTVNQLYFIISTGVSDNVYINTVVLKGLILLTELIGAFYLLKLFDTLKLPRHRIWILFLNPLWIIEATGNAHFEGVMIAFLMIAFYHLIQKNYLYMAIFFAIAIQIKLIPFLLLPFLIRFIGFKQSFRAFITIALLVVGISMIQLNNDNIGNYFTSLRLYFKVFEFNSFALYYTIQLGQLLTGWNQIRVIGPLLALTTLFIVSRLAYRLESTDWKSLFRRMTLAYLVYLLLSSTIHPWYILPLLFLSVFTTYSFGVLWSGLIFLSYIFYQHEMSEDLTYRIVVFAEYAMLISIIYLELRTPFRLFPWLKVS